MCSHTTITLHDDSRPHPLFTRSFTDNTPIAQILEEERPWLARARREVESQAKRMVMQGLELMVRREGGRGGEGREGRGSTG